MIGFGGSVVAAGCATSVEPTDDDDTTSTSDGGSGGNTTVGNGGMGGGTGGSGVGGMGGGPFPCGTDCSKIATTQCFEAICNEAISMCEVVPLEAGTACDDEVFCTTMDTCQAGVCVGGPQNDCGMTAPDCNAVICDDASSTCSIAPADDTMPCQVPGNLCLAGSTCSSGVCTGGALNDCFFVPLPNECHVAVCEPATGMCVAYPGNDGQGCVDSAALCDVGKTCSLGMCVGGAPLDCSALTMGCFDGVCDTATGQCTTAAVLPGQQCAEATDQCNVGICDAMTNCLPTPTNEAGACDTDGCFVGQTCATGTCQGGAEITACVNNDGCCPAMCDLTNDDDCGCNFGLISNETQLGDPAITAMITANGHTFVLHDNNNNGVHTSNMALLNMYDTIILHEHDRLLPASEATNLTNWVQAGGSLLVTGYDSLGSPTDPALAAVLNCLNPSDGPFSNVLTVTTASHPILQGPAQAFAPGAMLTAGSTDHDTCQPGPNAVQLVTVTTSSKLIVTDNVGQGRVLYWNGNGTGSGPLVEWTGAAGTQPDLQNLFVNVLDHMCQ